MAPPMYDLSFLVPLSALSDEHRAVVSILSAERSAALARALYREWKNNPAAPNHLSEVCDRALASEFSLEEWLKQVARTYEWLRRRESTAHFSDVLEYVSCAFEGSSLQPGHNLDWYLTNFGFARCLPLANREQSPLLKTEITSPSHNDVVK
ncbi:MAG: hypothetical protein RIS36_1487 [Pseudomonadota bacterium]|jgi:hypothetical protein